MQNDKALNVILYGRKFKKMTDRIYEKLRQEYDLKQIEVEILYYLSQRPEDSACDIYRNLYLNKGHVSQALSSLCKKGFLKASIDPDDRRYISYSIQKKGSNMIEETGRIKTEMFKNLLRGIKEEDLIVMRRVSEILSKNIDCITI